MNNINKFNKFQLLQPGIWFNYYISIDNKVFNIKLIHDCITKFWNDIMFNLGEKYVLLYFRIQFSDSKFRTIGNLQKLNNHDYIKLFSILINLFNILNYDYKNKIILNIVITYKIIGFDDKLINTLFKGNKILTKKLPTNKFYGYNLPNTMDYKLWGNIICSKRYANLINIPNTDLFYKVISKREGRMINILTTSNLKILKFNDYYLHNNYNLNTFTRIINNESYQFLNGKLIIEVE
jgi:hypothetical protein